MSGGEYEYIYRKLEDFLEDYKSNLENLQRNDEFNIIEVIPQYYWDFYTLVECMIPVFKAVEWEHSGDGADVWDKFIRAIEIIETLELGRYIKPKIPTVDPFD